MKTAVICFEGGSLYTKEKQLRNILREENEPIGIMCHDYDELDMLVPILKEKKINKMVILHDDKTLDRFEAGCQAEYGHLIEKIECVPDFSIGLEKLYEADTGQQAQAGAAGHIGTTRPSIDTSRLEKDATYTSMIIYPSNPLCVKNHELGDKTPESAPGKQLLVSYIPFNPERTGMWNLNAPANANHFEGGKTKSKFAIGRTIQGLQNKFGQLPITFLKNNNAQQQNIQTPEGTSIGVKAYQIGVEIAKGKAKPDEKKLEEWENSEKNNAMIFGLKQLGDIQYVMTLGNKDITEEDGSSFINKALKQFGFYEDLKTMNNNLRNGGLGLLVDAAALITDELSKKKERKSKESDGLVSHPKFEEFVSLFGNVPNDFKEV